MQFVKLLSAVSIAVACMSVEAGPVLQLGITNGSYDSGSDDVITSDNVFTLNAFGKATGGNAVSTSTNYFLSIAILADASLNPVNFGSFILGANTYTIIDMVFGSPPVGADQENAGGHLGAHGVYDTWFMQYAFQFSGSDLTTDVNVENTPGFAPLANAGDDYFFKSFNVNTQGLAAGYNLHFDLFTTVTRRNGDVAIGSHAPFSHDASTDYVYETSAQSLSTVPEPSTFVILGLALAALGFSRKLVWPAAQKAK